MEDFMKSRNGFFPAHHPGLSMAQHESALVCGADLAHNAEK